jgi:aryl-alcohol dehydrogenase-like predicted oxidoreductase
MLCEIGAEREATPLQATLNWVRNKPCDTVIIGVRNEEQLSANLAAAEPDLPIEGTSARGQAGFFFSGVAQQQTNLSRGF